jgi:hypothetical protein
MDISKVKIKNNQLKIKRNIGMGLICCVSIIAPRLNPPQKLADRSASLHVIDIFIPSTIFRSYGAGWTGLAN